MLKREIARNEKGFHAFTELHVAKLKIAHNSQEEGKQEKVFSQDSMFPVAFSKIRIWVETRSLATNN